MDFTVVIVSFKSFHIIEEHIKVIDKKNKIIKVENSLDKDLKLKLEKNYSNVTVIIPEENLGYGRALNLGIEKSLSKFVFCMVADLNISKDCFLNIENILEKFVGEENFLCSRFSKVRFNRYTKNTKIKKHFDHIYSIFDGKEKGIPVLSIVGLLNENFKGGNFIINDVLIKIKTGDFIVFPSCFLYPHQVKNITQGTRYSFVTWCY